MFILVQAVSGVKTFIKWQVLTEAEEECVHTHGVNAEKPMGNEVGAHQHSLREN